MSDKIKRLISFTLVTLFCVSTVMANAVSPSNIIEQHGVSQILNVQNVEYKLTRFESDEKIEVTVESVHGIVYAVTDKETGINRMYRFSSKAKSLDLNNAVFLGESNIYELGKPTTPVLPRRTLVDVYHSKYFNLHYYKYDPLAYGSNFFGEASHPAEIPQIRRGTGRGTIRQRAAP